MTRYVVWALIGLALGCGDGKKTEGSKESETSSSKKGEDDAPVQKLSGFDAPATLNGKPIELKTAIAYQRPDEPATEIWVSTAARDCDTASMRGIALKKNETMFRFRVVEGWLPDGTAKWKLAGTYYSGNTVMALSGDSMAVEPGKDATPWKIILPKMTLEAAGKDKDPLEVSGTIVAKSCGVVPDPSGARKLPPERAQDQLKVNVGGRAVAMKGAIYREKTKDVIVATRPMSCEDSPYSEAEVALIFDTEGTHTHLQGSRVGMQQRSGEEGKPKVELGTPADGKVDVNLEGTFKVVDWPVEMKGTASALVCAK